jgi:hypothetical protein
MVLSDAKKMLDLSGASRNRKELAGGDYESGRIKMNSLLSGSKNHDFTSHRSNSRMSEL